MTAEIICVGTELLLGNIVNTNAAFYRRSWRTLASTVIFRRWWEITGTGFFP